jgi:hypothetical protein
MKKHFYLLLALFVLPLSAVAQQTINGYITKEKGAVLFHSVESPNPVPMSAGSTYASEVLNKLESFDAVRGTAEVTPQGVTLQSIDFVGLKRLLGRWHHPKTGMTFRNFTDVSISAHGKEFYVQGNFKYAITPGNGDNWNVFLTDENQVVLSSLSIHSPKEAVMTFFDSKTGAVKGSIPLYRVSP